MTRHTSFYRQIGQKMTEMTGMFVKSISKVLRFEQEVCGWEKMREDKAKNVDCFGGKVKTGQEG
jgi:hypothetical protein